VSVGRNVQAEQYQLLPALTDEEYEALKADIALRGVMVPVEYDEAGAILDGHHRVRACEELGVKDWPRIVREGMSEEEKQRHVIALNVARRHLNESQRAMVAARLATMPKGRPSAGNGSIDPFSQPNAADVLNVSVPSVRRARVVMEDGTPDLVRAVDQGQIAVSQAAQIARMEPEAQQAVVAKIVTAGTRPQEARRQVKAETIAQREAAMPSGKYRVLLADPPWSYGNTQPDYHPEQRDHYPVMSLASICALPVIEWAMDNAVLFLWATSPILEDAFAVIAAWGFEYKASFVWDKVAHNMGHYNSVRHEFLLVCTRGACQPDVRKLFDSVVTEERTVHSRKPAVFYEIIETLYTTGPYLELFARARRKGWDVYGYESN
jgi:N6-adenosine-specific RNA methylase IME4